MFIGILVLPSIKGYLFTISIIKARKSIKRELILPQPCSASPYSFPLPHADIDYCCYKTPGFVEGLEFDMSLVRICSQISLQATGSLSQFKEEKIERVVRIS